MQFTVLNQAKTFVRQHGFDHTRFRNTASFVGGAAAGAAATLASYPFDLLRTVLASQGRPPQYSGMVDAARGLVAARGPLGLYAGAGVTLAEIIPYAGVQFGTYDLLVNAANKWRDPAELSHSAAVARTFVIGLLAGIAGKVRCCFLSACIGFCSAVLERMQADDGSTWLAGQQYCAPCKQSHELWPCRIPSESVMTAMNSYELPTATQLRMQHDAWDFNVKLCAGFDAPLGRRQEALSNNWPAAAFVVWPPHRHKHDGISCRLHTADLAV